uniref:GH18 domain-containing protein n=1 Tax=Oryza nivara TaxID=4536 RepID=A0A0E0G402_ORYNI
MGLELLLATPPPATADDPGLVVYWGRHKEEGSLRKACDTGHYTTVIITFYNVFGYGRYSLDISGHPLAASRGITVLLSIGGQGGGYSLPTHASAADVAYNLIWNAYLGGHRAGVHRPFGDDAAVDGIDFFIDQGGAYHYDDLARLLNGYNKFNVLVSSAVSATTLHISSLSLSSPAAGPSPIHHARDDVAGEAHQSGVGVDVLAMSKY